MPQTRLATFTKRASLALLLALCAAPSWAGCPAGTTCTTLNNFTVAGSASDTDLIPTAQGAATSLKQPLSAIWTWTQGHLASPGPIGGTTPSTGAFTGLSASGTVSGTGFSNYLASPPAIGGSAPGAGNFTTLGATGAFTSNITGLTQCVQANSSGVLSGTGSACGGGGGGGVSSVGLALPNFITVSGSPVTTSGTLTGTLATQTANTVFAGPASGAAAAPTFRSLASSDLPPFTQQEVTTSCSILTTSGGCSGSANGDMGNGVVLGGSGATLTLSAKATGLWQPGQTFAFSVDPAATGNWTLTNSSTLTLRGLNVTTTLYPGESGTFVADSDGSHLDCINCIQPPTTGAIGGVNAIAATTHEWINAIGTTGLPTQTQPACGDLSNSGTACLDNTGTSGATIPLLNGANSWSGSQRGVPVNVTISTATFTPNFNTAQNFEIDLTSACPCTLANPSTTLVAGQSGMIEVHQDATGSRTIGTWGADYQYAGGTATITLSTTANAVDYLSYYVNNAATGIVLGTILKNPAH